MEARNGVHRLPVLHYDLIKHGVNDKFGFTVTDKKYKKTGLYRTEQIIVGSIAYQVSHGL